MSSDQVALLETAKRIHFIGIGGVGMSGLAAVMHALGRKVSGSDSSSSSYTERLVQMGIEVYQDHKSGQGSDADVFVVSTAIRKDNPELLYAQENGIPILHRSDVMAYICNSRRGIAIAGAHGKTTTTGMVGKIFFENKLEPTLLIGALIPEIGSNAIYGRGPHGIAEADESDGSFLKLRPMIGLVTNIEDDHLDHYGSLEKLLESFVEFLEHILPEGYAVLCSDCVETLNLTKAKIPASIVRYGFLPEDDAQAVELEFDAKGSRFALIWRGEKLGIIQIPLPGRHNVLNALGAATVALLEGISFDGIARALATFHGAHRRFQWHGEVKGIQVIDDYAHHPTELRATLSAARQTHPEGRIVAIFQPHRYSRTRQLGQEFGQAFSDADVVVLTDIYSAGEEPLPGIDGAYLIQKIEEESKHRPHYIPQWQEIAVQIISVVQPGDLVLTLGAGSINQVAPRILEALRAQGTGEDE